MFYVDSTPVVRCVGNGQGTCFRCKAFGRQPIHWMTMLYKSDHLPGLICPSCLRELASLHPNFVREVV